MLGQGIIDTLLQVSGPMTRPAGRRLEGLWLEALAHPSLSRAAGRFADVALPRLVLQRLIDAWVQAYDVDMSVAEVPPAGFSTLDAFFTRRLVPGCRPVDHDPDVLVSPADSVLKSFGVVDARGHVPEVKGRSYGIAELLGGAMADESVGSRSAASADEFAKWGARDLGAATEAGLMGRRRASDEGPARPASESEFVGGTYGVYYLSPRDYHRVHAPTGGLVRSVTPLEGASYPVNALGVRRIEGLFVRNKRTVFVLDTDDGPVVLVMVGATNVGRITASVNAGERVEKGQELGIFHLGSTVVLLTPKSADLAYLRVHEGELVRYGQAVLHRR